MEAEVVGESTLLAATGNIKARLLKFYKGFVAPLVENFDMRIQSQKVAHMLRDIFDFRAMPLDAALPRTFFIDLERRLD